MSRDYLVNTFDVMRAAEVKPVVWVSFAPDYTLQSGGFGRKEGWNEWADVCAALVVTEWATCTNRPLVGHAWFPAAFADRVAALTIGENHAKVKVAVGTPCAALVHGSERFDRASRCGKPATGTGPASFRSNDSPLCNLHLAVVARVQANDAARRAEWDERDRKWEQARTLSRASAEWAQRLADEYGVDATGMHCDRGSLRVAAQPERLYAILSTAAGFLRDAGVEWAEVLLEGDGVRGGDHEQPHEDGEQQDVVQGDAHGPLLPAAGGGQP